MQELNPSQIGLSTELKCQIFLIEQGWNVSIPLGNYQKYDMIIERDNKFYRIQVKHAMEQETGFLVRTKYEVRDSGKTKKQTYRKEDIDYFMTEFKGKYYLFPIFGTTETRFWTVPPRLTNCKVAQNFLAEDILKNL